MITATRLICTLGQLVGSYQNLKLLVFSMSIKTTLSIILSAGLCQVLLPQNFYHPLLEYIMELSCLQLLKLVFSSYIKAKKPLCSYTLILMYYGNLCSVYLIKVTIASERLNTKIPNNKTDLKGSDYNSSSSKIDLFPLMYMIDFYYIHHVMFLSKLLSSLQSSDPLRVCIFLRETSSNNQTLIIYMFPTNYNRI